MANLLASFNSGVSGLHSANASLNTTAHNLANAHTQGYTRQQVLVTDSFYQTSYGAYSNRMQVGTGTVIAKTRQIRNTFLDAQYRMQVGRKNFYQANLDAAYELEDMMGELYGKQFSTSISDLKNALSSLAEIPGSIVYKDEVVSMAEQFIERAKVLQGELNTYQTSLNSEVLKQVNSINSLVTNIKDLNKEIRLYEATGESANDYRDKRNDYLDQLSEYISFEANEEIDGTISIYSEGGFLLDAENQYFLSVEYIEDASQLLKVVWAKGDDYFLRDGLRYSSKNNTDVGSLWGLMVARGDKAATCTDMLVRPKKEDFATESDYKVAMVKFQEDLEEYNKSTGASVVMTLQAQLDSLVHEVVTSVNDVLCPNKEVTVTIGGETQTIKILDEAAALIGDDATSAVGTELFSRRYQERYTEIEVEMDGTTMTVLRYNEEDPSDTYTMYTINQLVVNPTVLKDTSTLPVKYHMDSDARNGYAHQDLLSIAESFDQRVGALDPNSTTQYNVMEYYTGIVTELSLKGNVWKGIVDNQEITVSTVDNERQNVMGVSTEEELSDLIKFQQCYNASSRYITVVDEMIEHLIERLA